MWQDTSSQVLSEIKTSHDGDGSKPVLDNSRGLELLDRLAASVVPLSDYQQKISSLQDDLMHGISEVSVRDQVVSAVRTRRRHVRAVSLVALLCCEFSFILFRIRI